MRRRCPVWLGHPSSIAQRVLERLNADISETDVQGRPLLGGRVSIVAVVGNEDGAHKIIADLLQGLNDCGFSFAPKAATYWVGEAMSGTDYKTWTALQKASPRPRDRWP